MNQITIWQKDGRYFGEIPEFSLLASDDDPGKLVHKLETQIAELANSYKSAGRQLPSITAQRDAKGKIKTRLALFTAKVSIVAIAASVVIIVSIDSLSDRVRDGLFGGALGPFHLIDVMGSHLESMPPQVKDQKLKDIERLIRELEPYIKRINPLIQSDKNIN